MRLQSDQEPRGFFRLDCPLSKSLAMFTFVLPVKGGSWRLKYVFLKTAGHTINRKRVQGLMRQMGLAGMAPGPNTSRPHPEHKIYPYLLRGVSVSSCLLETLNVSDGFSALLLLFAFAFKMTRIFT